MKKKEREKTSGKLSFFFVDGQYDLDMSIANMPLPRQRYHMPPTLNNKGR